MIAHLGMYDMPHTKAANDTLWSEFRGQLGFGPDRLERNTEDFWAIWTHPDLLFSQTCGYPFRARLHDTVNLIGAPDHRLPDCPPGYYHSVFVIRADDPRADLADFDGSVFAYNEALSQSGWAGPVHTMIEKNVRPGALVRTGAHAHSAHSVATGAADFAALDAVTWELLQDSGSERATGLRVLARTPNTPALPYITSKSRDPQQLASALRQTLARLPNDTKHALRVFDLVSVPAATYLAVPNPPRPDELLC